MRRRRKPRWNRLCIPQGRHFGSASGGLRQKQQSLRDNKNYIRKVELRIYKIQQRGSRVLRRDKMSAKVWVRLRLIISDYPLMILGNII